MTTLLLIVWIVLAILLMFVMSVQPKRSRHSWFELKRMDDVRAMEREKTISDIVALLRWLSMIIVILLSAVSVFAWQGWGIVYTVLVLTLAHALASKHTLKRLSYRAYQPLEPQIIAYLEKIPSLAKIIGSERKIPQDQRLESTEQLLHLIEAADDVLTHNQQKLLRNGLNWHEKTVKKVMTLRDEIITIKHKELLGPLVLDDLHRSGHTQFPVIAGDIDAIVGVINITDLLEVDSSKKSHYADKIMSTQVVRVGMDESLPDALKLFQKSRQHIIIVVNDQGQTAGLLTLTDIANSLLGRASP